MLILWKSNANIPRPSRRRMSQGAKDDFTRECRLLASLHHHNVARLVGVVTGHDSGDDSEIGSKGWED